MKSSILTLALFFLISLLGSFSSYAFERGGGVGNGGSGYQCGDAAPVIVEHLLASRSSMVEISENREEFIHRILGKIRHPLFKQKLYARWLAYGDSQNWPDGDASRARVYYFRTPLHAVPYNLDARIPAQATSNPVCSFPAYEPWDCCDRVLLSFFVPSGATPLRVPQYYHQLTRAQKNVLELHEAVYRMAWDMKYDFLGLHVPVDPELEAYAQLDGATGEMPATQVVQVLIQLLSDSSGPDEVEAALIKYWAWANRLLR